MNQHSVVQVDTEICEWLFSLLSGYSRITQHINFNEEQFMFYLLYLCDEYNKKINSAYTCKYIHLLHDST